MTLNFAPLTLVLAITSATVVPAEANETTGAIHPYSAVYASDDSMSDLSHHADNIVATNRALAVDSTVCAKGLIEAEGASQPSAIVAEYGQSLKGPLAYIIGQPILFDAEVLPYDKTTIKAALVECAKQLSLTDSELASLGDLHFYLSYFIVGLDQEEVEPERDPFEEQRAEGLALRSEWKNMTAHRPRNKFSQFIARWVRPNA